MKKTAHFLILALAGAVLFFSAPAQSQETSWGTSIVQNGKPVLSTPEYIAMVFYRLTQQNPPYESWAKLAPGYAGAPSFEQASIIEKESQRIKEAFTLLTLHDPMVIQTTVVLSEYNATNHGFFVKNFRTSTFFPAKFNGQSFAIVPREIMEKQWLKVEDPEVVKAIEAAAAKGGGDRTLSMVLYLLPKYADKSPATIDGEDYWPIAADVQKMMLYPYNGDTLLWESASLDHDEHHQNILNLYQ